MLSPECFGRRKTLFLPRRPSLLGICVMHKRSLAIAARRAMGQNFGDGMLDEGQVQPGRLFGSMIAGLATFGAAHFGDAIRCRPVRRARAGFLLSGRWRAILLFRRGMPVFMQRSKRSAMISRRARWAMMLSLIISALDSAEPMGRSACWRLFYFHFSAIFRWRR